MKLINNTYKISSFSETYESYLLIHNLRISITFNDIQGTNKVSIFDYIMLTIIDTRIINYQFTSFPQYKILSILRSENTEDIEKYLLLTNIGKELREIMDNYKNIKYKNNEYISHELFHIAKNPFK